MNGMIKFALGIAGLPPETVADIEKAMPGAARLIDAAKQLEPYLEQAQPHIEAIMPHVEALLPILSKAMPILKAEYPDIVSLLPTAQEIITFVGDKKKTIPLTQADPSKSGSG